jgi:hypothetical protein
MVAPAVGKGRVADGRTGVIVWGGLAVDEAGGGRVGIRVADGAGVVALTALWVRISITRVSIKAVAFGPASEATIGVEQAANRRKKGGSRKQSKACGLP